MQTKPCFAHNNVHKFIFASSGAPVGEVIPPIHEEVVPHPISPYGASKLAGEAYCSVYANSYGIETSALRFGNVYGPGSLHKTSVVAKFINNILQNKPLEIYGDGSQTRDFIFIDDLIKAVLACVHTPDIGGEVFQIATSTESTVSEVVDTLSDLLNEKWLDAPVVKYSEPRNGDVKRNFSDTSKAKNILSWQSEYDLKQGMSLTLDWFLKTHKTSV